MGHSSTNAPRSLVLRNRQRIKPLDLKFLRQVLLALLEEACPERAYDLAFYFVTAAEITRLNEAFLQHEGSTDVITFDYADEAGAPLLYGEIFVCVEQAILHARQFRTTWQSEVVRYTVHGLLHLLGHDDLHSRARRKMKAAEDRFVRHLARQFSFRKLAKRATR